MIVDTGERYFPEYLFRGPRPIITSVTPSESLQHGQSCDVNAAGPALNSKARDALIRPAR